MQKMERMIIVVATILAVNFALPLFAADPAAPVAPAVKNQTTCPVMEGNAINKKLFVDYEGKRIYVCCRGCIGEVNGDPAKYVKKLEAEGITLETVPQATTKAPAAGSAQSPAVKEGAGCCK